MIEVGTKEELRLHLENEYVVIDFGADWCMPCRNARPIFKRLADTYTNMRFLSVNVDKVSSVLKDYDVRLLPTFLILKKGMIVGRVVGDIYELEELIKLI